MTTQKNAVNRNASLFVRVCSARIPTNEEHVLRFLKLIEAIVKGEIQEYKSIPSHVLVKMKFRELLELTRDN